MFRFDTYAVFSAMDLSYVLLRLTSERSPFYLLLGLCWIRRWPLRQGTSGSRTCRLESESVVRCVWWDG